MKIFDAIPLRTFAVLGAGALVVVGLRAHHAAPPPPLPLASEAESERDPGPAAAVAADDAPVRPYAIDFAFDVGNARWLAITEVPAAAVTDREPARVLDLDGGDWMSVARVRSLPASARAWQDREIAFDDGCREALHEFAVIGRVSGVPEMSETGRWDARSIAEQGTVVLAAQVEHCHGSFASTSPIRTLETVADPDLEARARARALASPLAAKAAHDWKDMHETTWPADAEADAILARDGDTTWVSVHVKAGGIGCGAPAANFWALYRVRAGNPGALEQVALREVNVEDQLQLVEVGGRLALIGTAMFPIGRLVLDEHGDERATDIVPYIGCPC